MSIIYSFYHLAKKSNGKIVIFVFLLIYACAHGQTGNLAGGRIEFYLLKKHTPNINIDNKLSGLFSIAVSDLADTPIITNHEIISCQFKSDTFKIDGKTVVKMTQLFKTTVPVGKRINKPEIPLCCGRQFALMVNGQIIYGGYFWNIFSSSGCDAITAFSLGDQVRGEKKLPDYGEANDTYDSRLNPVLINNLTLSGRLVKE